MLQFAFIFIYNNGHVKRYLICPFLKPTIELGIASGLCFAVSKESIDLEQSFDSLGQLFPIEPRDLASDKEEEGGSVGGGDREDSSATPGATAGVALEGDP